VNQAIGEAGWQQRIRENPQSFDRKHELRVAGRGPMPRGSAISSGEVEKINPQRVEKRGKTTANRTGFLPRTEFFTDSKNFFSRFNINDSFLLTPPDADKTSLVSACVCSVIRRSPGPLKLFFKNPLTFLRVRLL